MKPDTTMAMRTLIAEVRESMPFGLPGAQVCNGPCDGCSVRLLTFLQTELDGWEQRLDAREKPGLAELSRLAKTSRKIHRILARNGLVTGGEAE